MRTLYFLPENVDNNGLPLKTKTLKDQKMKKACLFVSALILLSSLACQAGPARGAAPKPQTAAVAQEAPASAPAKPVVAPDRVHDDLAAFLSGVAGTAEPWKARESAASWQSFAASSAKHWTAFETGILEPMKKWAGEDLRETGLATKTLFYPFGGPDFVTAFAFYPDAAKTVLMGLEPVGNLPDFDKATPVWTDEFFQDLDTITSDFLKRGYFVTEHMNDVFSKGRVDGALPLVLYFLKRTGHSIVGIRNLGVDEKGEWTETAYVPLKKRPRRPYGVRIEYVRTGDEVVRSVEYFSCDLADAAFRTDSPLFRHFDGLEGVTTFIKSASYLLHYGEFSIIRNMILRKSLCVLEDDTGIPYHYFKRQGWEIQLYGAYAKPVEDFSAAVEQKDLKAVYEDPATNVRKLPFHFGYRWVSKIDNLLLMKKPPAKPAVS